MSHEQLTYPGPAEMTVTEMKVKVGSLLSQGKVALLYKEAGDETVKKLKCVSMGRVVKLLVKSGSSVRPGQPVLEFSGGCSHPTIMKDMCAECGADLRKEGNTARARDASVAMVHSIPELKVSDTEARNIGQEDQDRLLAGRKLVLLVDLDQTIIHTTNDEIPSNLKDVYHFQLYGDRSPWYHTRLRPGTFEFLQRISSLYELHICTFGARLYAHTIAGFLDPNKKFFSHRILSRDECFDSNKKTANMSALFPCGDSMVCIIDDREDVWNFAPNLVHVKPYHFFKHTGDINAPPGLAKRDNDGSKHKPGLTYTPRLKKSPSFKGTIQKLKKKDSETSSSSSEGENDESEGNVDEKKETVDDNKVNEDAKSDDNEPEKEKSPEQRVSDDLDLSDSDASNSRPATTNGQESSGDKVTKKNEGDSKEDDLVDPEDPDDYLLFLEDILKTLHKAFYDLYDQYKSDSKVPAPDLKTVIPYVKRKVLSGVVIVFSGVIPTQVPVERSKPFLVARSLGAKVRREVDSTTTHLVAARLGTAKVNDAKAQSKVSGNIHIVTPDWLWSCSERWERVSEALFTLTKTSSVTRRPPAHCSSPEIAFAERCADIDLNLDGGLNRQPSVAEADPFLAFSSGDLADMDKEVEDILSGDSDSDSELGDGGIAGSDGSSSEDSQDSLTGVSRGHKRKLETIQEEDREIDQAEEDTGDGEEAEQGPGANFRAGRDVPSDFEVGDQSDDSGDEEEGEEGGDWSLMGAALEKELE